jgi:hypothetical protein
MVSNFIPRRAAIVKPHRVPSAARTRLAGVHLSRAPWLAARGMIPAENWIVLSGPEWGRLLPPANAGAKSSWDVPHAVAIKLAEWVIPNEEEPTTAAGWISRTA